MMQMTDPEEKGLKLIRDENGLKLTDGELELRGDFTRLQPRLKYNNLTHEILVKAAKIKGANSPLELIDATAGLGEDSLLFAAAGFHVRMFERDPVIAALLEDAMERAGEVPELAPAVGRMELVKADSIAYLRKLAAGKEAPAGADTPDQQDRGIPDVIFLDPMFPERQKSAMIKKKMQLLQRLESPCTDERELLEVAMAVRPRKVVVKRPLKGPYLAGLRPDYSISGKAIRCDCFVFAR
jgi:16S rRNA (guanine1516-N2)-methyltransferase